MFPEGPFPTLRVGSQPYGLLPATALAQWRAADGDPPVERALVRPLRTLRDRFRDAAVQRGNAVGATEQELMDLIGALPTSSYFRHRLAWPLEMWWLATALSGTRASWIDVHRGWRSDFGAPRRRGRVRTRSPLRGASCVRTGDLPLVVPAELAADDALSNC